MLQDQTPASKNATLKFMAIATALSIVGMASVIEHKGFMKETPDHSVLESRATAAMQKACHAYADSMNGTMTQAGLNVSRVHNQHVYDHCLRQKLS